MTPDATKKSFNWWKLGFFIALIAFELARESAVLEAHRPMGGQMFNVGHYGGLIHAEGQWFRSDGGSPIQPGTVSIDCFEQWRTCIESSTVLSNTGVRWASTSTDLYDIEEMNDLGVTYVGTGSDCAVYRVRIDLQQERVVGTRTAKEAPSNPICAAFEKRVEMHLADGTKKLIYDETWREKLTLPLFNLIGKIL